MSALSVKPVSAVTPLTSLPSISDKLKADKNLKPLEPISNAPRVVPEDLEWANKLDKKMEWGYIPRAAEKTRYDNIVANLTSIRDGGGYVYQDKTVFSNNPQGISAIGSLVGRTLSGGYIGYKYGDRVGTITRDTYNQVKNGLTAGEPGQAWGGFVTGFKQVGALSLKSGAISTVMNTGTSIVANVINTTAGNQSGAEGIGNVAGDAVGGFFSGVGASMFSGGATLGMTLAGATGLPVTIVGVAGGAVGSVLIDKAYKGSGLFTVIKNRVMEAIDEPASEKQNQPL